MNNNDILQSINDELKKECHRIFDELMKLYTKRIRVNKSFSDLVREKINKNYSFFYMAILRQIMKLIPNGLNVCPTGEWVFITDKELNDINDRKYNDTEKNLINNFINNIVEDIISLNYDNLFLIIEKYRNKYLNGLCLFDYTYLLENINNRLIDNKIKIISIDPLKIKIED